MLDITDMMVCQSDKHRIRFMMRTTFDEKTTGKVFDLLRAIGDTDNRNERDKLGYSLTKLFDDPTVDKAARLADNHIPLVFLCAHLATADVFDRLTVDHTDANPALRIGNEGAEYGILEFMARRQPSADDDRLTVSGNNGMSDRLGIYRNLIQRADIDLGYQARNPSYNFTNLFSGNSKKERRFDKAIKAWIRNRHAIIAADDKQALMAVVHRAFEATSFSSETLRDRVLIELEARIFDPSLVKRARGELPQVKGIRLKSLKARAFDTYLVGTLERDVALRNTAAIVWKSAIKCATRHEVPKRERQQLQKNGQSVILGM